jgi:predicted TIM-barrel fold metal-dependent hydrolase
MKDIHIHIGQFCEFYYEPIEVINIVMESGMEGLAFSSTTTGKDNVKYGEIETEISSLLSHISWPAQTVSPFFWCIPDYIQQGISVEKTMANLPYKGIKLHPRNNWLFNDTAHIDMLHSLFNYAETNSLPILLHTGHDEAEEANRFSCFFGKYSKAQIILAHARPLAQTIGLMNAHRNLYCDTAFVEEGVVKHIIGQGLASKIFLGSDFPITHYYIAKYSDSTISLENQYKKDAELLALYGKLLSHPAH